MSTEEEKLSESNVGETKEKKEVVNQAVNGTTKDKLSDQSNDKKSPRKNDDSRKKEDSGKDVFFDA